MNRALSVGLMITLASACTKERQIVDNPPPPPPPPTVVTPNYFEQVRPILAERCGECHLPGGIGPFAFDTYDSAGPLAALIVSALESRSMPPWGAHESPECEIERPFKHDLRLDDDEIATIREWNDKGAPEGPVPDQIEPFTPKVRVLENTNVEMEPRTGFTTEGLRDQFRCFVLDPEFTAERHLAGVQFFPGNDQVVHHILLYADTSGTEADALADADGQYDCFGGPGIGSPLLAGAWAPGSVPFEFPGGAAMPLPAATKFVMQIHYHPIGEAPESDLTSVKLKVLDEAPEFGAAIALIGNFDDQSSDGDGLLPGPADNGEPTFRIPAGAKGHTEKMRFTIPDELGNSPFPGVFVHGVSSHMHYVGTKMTTRVIRNSMNPECAPAEVQPLEACVAANCPNATTVPELFDCASTSCEAEADALPTRCGNCLEAQLIAGNVGAIDACGVAAPMPTHYGPLPDQTQDECLLETPDWNFEWQRVYIYDAEITDLPFLRAYDTFEFSCEYDNSMDNPFVRNALAEQGLDAPRDVVLGDETLDEMCLFVLSFIYKIP